MSLRTNSSRILFVIKEHANFLKITLSETLCLLSYQISGGLCSPSLEVTQSTEVLGWVFPMDWCFPPVEGVLTPVKFSLKTVDVWNKAVFRRILQEKLESLVRVLHVPEEICLNRRWVVAPQLQTGSFIDSEMAIGLGHWLGSSSSWNISAESMNSAKTKSLYSKPNWNNVPCTDKGVKWNASQEWKHLKVDPTVMAEQWRSGENLSWRSCTNKSLKTGWLEPRLLWGWGMKEDLDFSSWRRLCGVLGKEAVLIELLASSVWDALHIIV